jgi:hypothetical protein
VEEGVSVGVGEEEDVSVAVGEEEVVAVGEAVRVGVQAPPGMMGGQDSKYQPLPIKPEAMSCCPPEYTCTRIMASVPEGRA